MIITWAEAEERCPGSSVEWDAMHYPSRDPDPPYAWRVPAPRSYTVETLGTENADLYVFEGRPGVRLWWWDRHEGVWTLISWERSASRVRARRSL